MPSRARPRRELSTERFTPGNHPVNKPNPGVYARNNAVDMPAMLPDGTTAEESVPSPLRLRGEAPEADLLALEEAEHLLAHEAATPGAPATEGEESRP